MSTKEAGTDTRAVGPDNGNKGPNARKRKLAAYVAVAVLVVAGVVVGVAILGGEDGQRAAQPSQRELAAVEVTDPEELPEPTMDLAAAIDRIQEKAAEGAPDLRNQVDVRAVPGIRLTATGATSGLTRAWYEPALLVGQPGQKLTISLSNPDPWAHTFTLRTQGIDVYLHPNEEDAVRVQVTFPQNGDPLVFYCKLHQLYGQTGGLVAVG